MQSLMGVMVYVLPEGIGSIMSLNKVMFMSEYFSSLVVLDKQSPGNLENLPMYNRKQIGVRRKEIKRRTVENRKKF